MELTVAEAMKWVAEHGIGNAIQAAVLWIIIQYGPKLVTGHLDFLKSMALTQSELSATQKEQRLTNDRMAVAIEKQSDALSHLVVAIEVISDGKAISQVATAKKIMSQDKPVA